MGWGHLFQRLATVPHAVSDWILLKPARAATSGAEGRRRLVPCRSALTGAGELSGERLDIMRDDDRRTATRRRSPRTGESGRRGARQAPRKRRLEKPGGVSDRPARYRRSGYRWFSGGKPENYRSIDPEVMTPTARIALRVASPSCSTSSSPGGAGLADNGTRACAGSAVSGCHPRSFSWQVLWGSANRQDAGAAGQS